ncbi:unnamed protein product [Spirodela intermedia]|uniref:Uncharacterized protein n=1 Tax=Spirodela intermedia TaxID=51605 RepID=A0A7I8IUF1_SPIIN|nr:unnamed protein product [Spirodela intermedia]CAA6661626.1 unnamed protein product [Spirodela intermedia]
MTFETSDIKEVCEVSKADSERECVLVSVAREDKMKLGDCNGIACGEGKRDLEMDVKSDCSVDQRPESGPETDDLSERDLDAEGRVQKGISEGQSCLVENVISMPISGEEVEVVSSCDKESCDSNDERGDLILLEVEEEICENLENGEVTSENEHECKEMNALHIDLENAANDIRRDPSTMQMCEESFVNVSSYCDGFNKDVIVNSKSEDQVDGKSLTAITFDVKDENSKYVVERTDGSATLSLENEKEAVTSTTDDNFPGSTILAAVKDGSGSFPPQTVEMLTTKKEDDVPAAEKSEVVTVKDESASLPPQSEEVLASNIAEDVPATEQSDALLVAATDESDSLTCQTKEVLVSKAMQNVQAAEQSEIVSLVTGEVDSLPPESKELLASSETGDAPAAEQLAVGVDGFDSRAPESEEFLVSNIVDVIPETEQPENMIAERTKSDSSPLVTEEEMAPSIVIESAPAAEQPIIVVGEGTESQYLVSEKKMVASELEEKILSCMEPELGNEATEILVDTPEGSRTVDDKGSEAIFVNSDENSKGDEQIIIKEFSEPREDISASSLNDTASNTKMEVISNEDRMFPFYSGNAIKSETQITNDLLKSQDCVTSPDVEARWSERVESASPFSDSETKAVTEISTLIFGTSTGTVSYNTESESTNKDDPNRLAGAEEDVTEQTREIQDAPVPTDELGSSSLHRQKVDTKEQQIFIARIPRFSDSKLKMKIEHAQREVDEKTKNRDSIRVQMQNQKAVCTEYWLKIEDARKEERASRDAVTCKRQEIDSIQSILGKLKNAHSIADIDKRIHNLQHRISHETNTLKEEKMLMREISQLKQSRDHLSSSLGSEEELQEALDNQGQMETQIQHLKEELDLLRKKVQHAEGDTKAARSSYEKQHELLRDLQAKFKAADDLRQQAYTNLRDLKKESYLKNQYFYSYKDDLKAVSGYNASKDKQALRSYCIQQVEKIMDMWNNDDEFRRQYVEANTLSTVRRFRTFDGRSLGFDEEPAAFPTAATVQAEEVSTADVQPPAKTDGDVPPAPAGGGGGGERAQKGGSSGEPALTRESKAPKPAAKEVVRGGDGGEEAAETERKKKKKTAEEEELARKAEELARREEELRKEKLAAELRERHRLEQIAKAKDAEERKRRQAEKAQARAEMRAQKEAELREKKKAKKEKKKMKKKKQSKAAPQTKSPPPGGGRRRDRRRPSGEARHRSHRRRRRGKALRPPVRHTRDFLKLKPLPPPLRNRGKRKLQPWLWAAVAALLVAALFAAGKYISLSKLRRSA